MSDLYILRGLTSGWLKIGCTRTVWERALALTAQYRESVEVLAVFPGNRREEYDLHREFKPLRVVGQDRGREWYADDGTIAAFIATLPASQRGAVVFEYDPTPRSPRVANPRYIDGKGLRRIDFSGQDERHKRNAEARHNHPANQPAPKTCPTCASIATWRERRRAMWERALAQPFVFGTAHYLPKYTRSLLVRREAA